MDDHDNQNRINKFEKRRKNTRSISILMILGLFLILILLFLWIFGGNDDNPDETEQETSEQNDGQANSVGDEDNVNDSETNDDTAANDEVDGDNSSNNDEDESDDQNTNSDDEDSDDISIPSGDVDIEEIDNPEDDNVIKAYTGNWEPIGTSQSEPHEVQYNTESQDWMEMEEAIKYAAGLDEMITQRIRNGGEQKVIGIVSAPDNTIYRVNLTWQTNEGRQPEKVEILKELDKNEW